MREILLEHIMGVYMHIFIINEENNKKLIFSY